MQQTVTLWKLENETVFFPENWQKLIIKMVVDKLSKRKNSRFNIKKVEVNS